jgi:uncharacterized glyoxalase superfamily protein PhnB
MADPLAALRGRFLPVDPDPDFAASLRSRITQALDPLGGTMSDLLTDRPTGPDFTTVGVVPYLAVHGADRALRWYAEAFGAESHGQPIVMPDGRIGHAELGIGGATIMLSEEHPEIGVAAPSPGQGVAVTLHLEVDDVDAVIGRAVTAGARLERPAADYEYGRNGVLRDPFGHRWMIAGPVLTPGLRSGDLGYVSLWVPDVDRAAAFFSTVLGWTYGAASGPRGRQVEGRPLHHGLLGGVAHGTLFLCAAVDDVQAAVGRVQAGGGIAEPPHEEPYGLVSGCVDDQGVSFAVFEPPGGTSPRRSAPPWSGPVRSGDLVYVTMEVVDAARARAFYGAVLGWRFTPGRTADGWQVDGVAPMVGLSGGHGAATTVGVYQVDDIAAAVDLVRLAGGAATEPEAQPYGILSSCTDDQGTRFALVAEGHS